MTKQEACKKAEEMGAGFVAHLITSWHPNPAKKLKGLVTALKAGKGVSIGQHDIDILLIDGKRVPWDMLEKSIA